MLSIGINDISPESIRQPQRLHALVASTRNLDQSQFTLQWLFMAEFLRPHCQVHNPVNGDDTLELGLDLLQNMRRAACHDCDTR